MLTGGTGNDAMNGGAGNDTFVFAAAGFGGDTITGFDANPGGGGQDRLDISGLGINAAAFAGSVSIALVAGNTLVTIGADTIQLNGVNGLGANVINIDDFLLSP